MHSIRDMITFLYDVNKSILLHSLARKTKYHITLPLVKSTDINLSEILHYIIYFTVSVILNKLQRQRKHYNGNENIVKQNAGS